MFEPGDYKFYQEMAVEKGNRWVWLDSLRPQNLPPVVKGCYLVFINPFAYLKLD